jgi:hypothetical protein
MWLITGPGKRCLDVKGATSENNTPIILFDKHARDNQRWMFTSGGLIVSILDKNKCLDVAGGNTANGTPIILHDRHGGTNQQWKLTLDGAIVSALDPNKCLTVAGSVTNGDPIVLSDRGVSLRSNQVWTPELNEPVEFPDGSPIPPEYDPPIFAADGRLHCSVDDSARWKCRFEVSIPTAMPGIGGTIDDPALADRLAKELIRELNTPSVRIIEFSPPASIKFSISSKILYSASRVSAIKSLEFDAEQTIKKVGL